ncbi:hypothetical protein EVAR_45787_1 [Eumeta japonica]|uniref:Uncharacterized protein n=1 Tax=Eumeta variegata TaxID=151549 RepID=A0A4C1X236_EUMVA|nr:hypothetical protein EVAR_45787_1 [Eumeta japonica]
MWSRVQRFHFIRGTLDARSALALDRSVRTPPGQVWTPICASPQSFNYCADGNRGGLECPGNDAVGRYSRRVRWRHRR